MPHRSKRGLSTRLIHASETNDIFGSHLPPLYETSTFCFPTIEQARVALIEGYAYSRVRNPTLSALERALTELEGEAALTFRSGMAAIATSILALTGGKDNHILCNFPLYGGAQDFFMNLCQEYGIQISYADAREPENIRRLIRENTKIIYLETPTNPTLFLADIKRICGIRDEEKPDTLVIVDNTFATPYNQQPLKLGADLTVHSLTKYLSGFGDVIAGAIMGSVELIERIRPIAIEMGTNASPGDAWRILTYGLKTFVLRTKQHNANALRLARFLENEPAVSKVYYPGLQSNPQYELALRQMRTPDGKSGFGGMVSFELHIEENSNMLEKFLDALPFKKGVSLGFPDTVVEHPATMTHGRISKEDREAQGISDNLIRVSVGLEDFKDIKNGFKLAFKVL